MSRPIATLICALLGLALMMCGLQVPAHLRAVDASVLRVAGKGTPSLATAGMQLVHSDQLGPAELFLAAARAAWITNSPQLANAVEELAIRRPELKINGCAESGSVGELLATGVHSPATNSTNTAPCSEPFTDFVIRADNRSRALKLLQDSKDPIAVALLQLRSLTNTVLFPASSSSSGQALDSAIAIGGLLADTHQLSVGMVTEMTTLTTEARRGGDSAAIEQVLMDLLSLGQRFNWGQLAAFVSPIPDAATLQQLTDAVRRGEGIPDIFTAVCLTGDASGVAGYLNHFSETGVADLRSSLQFGAGGLQKLVERRQQLCNSPVCQRVASFAFAPVVSLAAKTPAIALATKWLLYLLGGFFAAASFHYARRIPPLERPLQVRGFHFAREFLFASGFLLVVLLLSEPFLAQDGQQAAPPFRLRLPSVSNLAPTSSPGVAITNMNQITFLTMLLFFVLQALLYVASLVKLAEIRRQRVSSKMKLKLLANEDHLFDAGLYLGFLGTIISLILVSLGVFKQPSLMAAYSSTSFGILFVVLFKVVHLRGARRQLLMLAEAEPPSRSETSESTLAAPL